MNRRVGMPTLLVVVVVLSSVVGCRGRPRVSPMVTPERIRQISLGMSRADLLKLMGDPIRVRPADNAGGVLLDYAIDGLALHSVAVWISLTPAGTVSTVRVEENPLFASSFAIYDLRPGGPRYEHPDFGRIVNSQR